MSAHGTSTFTFLFTDIEGSTQLWEQHPDAMRAALARHDALLQQAVENHNGRVFKTTGDGMHAVFADAVDSVRAVSDAQRALASEPWGEVGEVRVRMALHSGPAEPRGGDYHGTTLNRAARLMAIAHGGQVLLSDTTAALARDDLPPDVSLRDMGEHRLKDLVRPEHVFQLVADGLRAEFPPLRSLGAFPNNLPVQLTSFVGRECELGEIKRMLAATRLLTLTGPGGTGKTRLSLHLAADVLERFGDGVWLVELAPLSDPGLVAQTVASALSLREQPERPLTAMLIDFLRDKRLMLILDNCEHLIEGCAQLAETLLRAAPALHIVASSREPLGIAGESVYRVPPLSLPPSTISSPESTASAETGPGTADIAASEAVRLFVERAQAVRADFQLSASDAPAVAQICTRLDGIPLAIELAAARVKALSVSEIASRLDNQFRLLTGGSRTALPRQQTLRALIDWSYELLTPAECVAFRRLAVFAGGWTLDAAEQVIVDDGGQFVQDEHDRPPSPLLHSDDILDLLESLVNKSLAVSEPRAGRTRYRYLETIRQYARDKLVESGEAERFRDRQVDFVLRFAKEMGPTLRLQEGGRVMERVDVELENIRAALDWSLTHNPLATLQILGSLMYMWNSRGYITEGRRRFEEALARTEGAAGREFTSARALTFTALTALTVAYGDVQAARRARDQSLQLYRELGKPPEMALALAFALLTASFAGEDDAAADYFTDGLALARAAGDKLAEMMLFGVMTRVAANRHEYSAAQSYTEESQRLAREIGSGFGLAAALMASGMTAISRGDLRLARARLEESYALYAQLGNQHFINVTRSELAHIARLLGEYERAIQLYREVILIWKQHGHHAGIARCLECLGFIAGAQGNALRSARLLGAAEALRPRAHATMTPDEQNEYAAQLAAIRSGTDEAAFERGWTEGRALGVEAAIALALSDA